MLLCCGLSLRAAGRPIGEGPDGCWDFFIYAENFPHSEAHKIVQDALDMDSNALALRMDEEHSKLMEMWSAENSAEDLG